ncbi:hypothetical protein E2C01_065179 [Portunus trituberculatus]|uniref:Uncharacterized protein n=1 Tax=Portunus trituberculatus TaxID=210409 RepID=A0A5B7HNW9_PORTR|nr:hypothetical protein [Portunus trituberculatus]
MADTGDRKSKRREPSVPKAAAAGLFVQDGQHEEVSSVKGQNFIATAPCCPGFTGPVIVGVVWKKKFLCGGDKNEGNRNEKSHEGSVQSSCTGTGTPRRPGFTGPVIVGVTWKKQFAGMWDEVGEVEQAKNSRQKKDEGQGEKKKVSKWKKIWRWLTKKKN